MRRGKFLRGGLYLLLLRVDEPVLVAVGKLGLVSLDKGLYVYVGSARRGLWCRLRRHASRRKPLKWHIDYLTVHPGVYVAGAIVLPGSKGVREHDLVDLLKGLGVKGAVRGFGSTDDPYSDTHLLGPVSPEVLSKVLAYLSIDRRFPVGGLIRGSSRLRQL